MSKKNSKQNTTSKRLIIWVTIVCFLILLGVFFTFSTGLIRIGHHLHPASLLGIITALTGLLATIFGIGLAGVVAFQWGAFDKRVDEHLKEPIDSAKQDLQKDIDKSREELENDFARRMKAVAGLAIAWTKEPLDREADIERVLELDPQLPDVEPLMAEVYFDQILYSYATQPDELGLYSSTIQSEALKQEFLSFANKWAKLAIEHKSYHRHGLPEWVSALVAGLRKDTYNCLKYLEVAKQYGFLHQKGLIPFDSRYSSQPPYQLWETITSCTHGQKQLINRLMELLELEVIQQNHIQDQAEGYLSKNSHFYFWTIEKETGDCYPSNIQRRGEGLYQWWEKQPSSFRLSPDDGDSLEEIINEIFKKTIPIKIMNSDRK